MHLYSQHDPAFDQMTLGAGGTIHDFGCFLVSLANLYQRSPVDLLKIPEAFTPEGYLVAPVVAKAIGGEALAKTPTAPKGWCIGVTKDIPAVGTHFFCVNAETKEMIDPISFPAVVQPLKYAVVEYRPFTKVKLTTGTLTTSEPAKKKTAATTKAAERRNKRLSNR